MSYACLFFEEVLPLVVGVIVVFKAEAEVVTGVIFFMEIFLRLKPLAKL